MTTEVLVSKIWKALSRDRCLVDSGVDVYIVNALNSEANDNFMSFLEANNVLFHILDKYRDSGLSQQCLGRLSDLEERYKKLTDSVALLNELFDRDVVVHKTFRVGLRIPSDIDFLVPDFSEGLGRMSNRFGESRAIDESVPDASFYSNFCKLHMHGDIGWHGKRYLDVKKLFRGAKLFDCGGVQCLVPNYNDDLLINIAHIIFEELHVNLGELFHIKHLLANCDEVEILRCAEAYGWGDSCYRYLTFLKSQISRLESASSNSFVAEFPLQIPLTMVVKAFVEKRIFWEPVKKLPKVVRLLAGGHSFHDFYKAPESRD